jgi:hypothetical protein
MEMANASRIVVIILGLASYSARDYSMYAEECKAGFVSSFGVPGEASVPTTAPICDNHVESDDS